MGEDVIRSAAIGQHDLLEELLQIGRVVAEGPDIAALAIADQPVGIALAAPIERGDTKAAGGKVADGFEIFLDALVAAGQEHHGAPHRARHRREQAIADLLAVARNEKAAGSVFRSRIALGFVEKRRVVEKVRHAALCARRLQVPACRGWPRQGDRRQCIKSKANPGCAGIPTGKAGSRSRACFRPLSIREEGTLTPGSASLRRLSKSGAANP